MFAPPSRQSTDPALQRARDAHRRPTLPSETPVTRIQDKFPAYRDFPWEKIEEFLKEKWPAWTNFNPSRVSDYWQFEVPEELSDGDRKELKNRRDAPGRTRRPSIPE